MAQKITPAGYKLLVLEIEAKKHVTKGNIELAEGQLTQGKVLEVGLDAKNIYSEISDASKKNDIKTSSLHKQQIFVHDN